jgi:hypothetical protein
MTRSVSPKSLATVVPINPKTAEKLKHVTKSKKASKTTQAVKVPAIKKSKLASFPVKPIEKPTMKSMTETDKQNNVTEPRDDKKIILPTPIQNPGTNDNTKPHASLNQAIFDTPKAPNHPTRNFPIAPVPIAVHDRTTMFKPTPQAEPLAPMAQSPTRLIPFTTPLVHKPAVTTQTVTQSYTQSPGSTPQVSSDIHEGTSTPTKPAPVNNTANVQSPSPIQYYKDPPSRAVEGLGLDTAMLSCPPLVTQDLAQESPNVSEPPSGRDEFPVPDDDTDPMDSPQGQTQDSDEGYATATNATHDDMESDKDETVGEDSHDGSTTMGNQDDQSVGATTTATDNSNSVTDHTQVLCQSSQPKSDEQSMSRRSDSSGKNTAATDVTAATPPRKNCTDPMEVDSEDEEALEDANLVCPHPDHFKTFWRADYVTSIPTNTNPILAVAGKLGETLAILQTIDKDTSVYPYEANPSLKPIHNPADFSTLGTELYAYADKNNLWKYPRQEMKTCWLILCLAMNSDFRATCETFNRLAEDSQLYPWALNYPRIGRAGFFPMSHPHPTPNFDNPSAWNGVKQSQT